MSKKKPITLEPVYEGSSFTLAALIARISGVTETPIVQSDLSSIKLKVYDSLDPDSPVESDISISDSIKNTLQPWPTDSTGYNFIYVTDPSQIPAGGREYHFEFTFVPQSGHPILETFIVPTIGRYGVVESES